MKLKTILKKYYRKFILNFPDSYTSYSPDYDEFVNDLIDTGIIRYKIIHRQHLMNEYSYLVDKHDVDVNLNKEMLSSYTLRRLNKMKIQAERDKAKADGLKSVSDLLRRVEERSSDD